MSEEVVLLFIQKNSVLLAYFVSEIRKAHFFIPRTNIGDEEKKQHKNYIEHAMHKQVYREFHGTVMPLQYDLVDSVSGSDSNLLSHIYFIFSWDGDLPKYLNEFGNEKAKLQWFSVNTADSVVLSSEDKQVLNLAKEAVRIRSLLKR